jgi:hypothetical protein
MEVWGYRQADESGTAMRPDISKMRGIWVFMGLKPTDSDESVL